MPAMMTTVAVLRLTTTTHDQDRQQSSLYRDPRFQSRHGVSHFPPNPMRLHDSQTELHRSWDAENGQQSQVSRLEPVIDGGDRGLWKGLRIRYKYSGLT